VTPSRLASFTDGVIAIIITIMVLELPVPHAAGMAALQPLSVLFAAYALSFVKVGIYWSQHHNILQASKRVNGPVLLANLFFLFWLSLIPFVVRWVGEAGITRDTVLAFGVITLGRRGGHHPRHRARLRRHHAALHLVLRAAACRVAEGQ